MEGRTTKETAAALEKATQGMNQFIAKVGDAEFVITGVRWVPIHGEGPDHSIGAELVSPQSAEYQSTRKATPGEQRLVDQVQWIH